MLLGNFKGGELTFPELKLVIYVKQGQVVAFKSNIFVYGNLPVITGIRYSLVFTLIKQKHKFGSLFADCALNWNDDNNRDKSKPKYLPPMLDSGNSMKLKNHRWTHIDMCNLYI